jgi:hypothetical protein
MNRKANLLLSLIGLMTLGVATLASAEWYDTVKVFGDLRYREEMIQDESINNATAGKSWYEDRQRIRARFGLQAPIDDYWKATIRLASDQSGYAGGNGDPDSRNQTLTDGFSAKTIWLDQAYIDYKAIFNVLTLSAGKMPLPFEIVGGNKLIFKDDLAPEGIHGKLAFDVAPDVSLFVNGGGFWIRETAASYDPMMYSGQVGTKIKLNDLKLTVGVGEFYFTDLTNQFPIDYKTASPTAVTPGASASNPLYQGKYADNYYISEGFVQLTYPLFDIPVSVYSDNTVNNGATHFQKAYIVGLLINKAAKEGSWEVGYNWRLLEKSSLVGAFTDSDFVGGGVNADGHMVTAAYVPADGVKTTLTFFRNQKALDAAVNPYYNRFQADVVLSF